MSLVNSLSIDGKEVQFTAGETVLAAASRAGIDIPRLCAMDWACKPEAACRMCLVELEGMPRLQTSCTLEAKDGQKVRSRSPRVQAVRRNIVELLIAKWRERKQSGARTFATSAPSCPRCWPRMKSKARSAAGPRATGPSRSEERRVG